VEKDRETLKYLKTIKKLILSELEN